jgi:Cu(I)/Ag(I) efflux system membrane fusion protein
MEGSLTVGTPGVRLEAVAAGAEAAAPVPAAGEAGSPANAEEPHPAEFRIAPGRVQRIGVRISRAEERAVSTTVRAVGRVVAEETTLEDVSLKVSGWVEGVRVDAVGDPVERGEVLLRVYSPELYAAQEEYLQALRSQERARETGAPGRADYLVRAARNRLRLWDVAERDLEEIERSGRALERLPIRAPVTGYVVEKNLVEGSSVAAGQRLYRIASLSRIWIEAEVYEQDLPLVEQGQTATVTLPYLPARGAERSFEGTIAYVYPTLDPRTRTARVRLELPNADLALRPDMYANVRIRADRGTRLVVPESAVLYTGERTFVFRSLGEGRFRPQAVELGLRSGEDVEVLSGLEAGDEIVSSGTFLIASESRLRSALEKW